MQMGLYYKIDERERIIEVGGDWDRSAIDHASDECVSKYVIGAKLFDYISGDHAKMWLRTIIKSVRVTETADIRLYRCDTPSRRRRFLQTVELDEHGNILVRHELAHEEHMPISVRVSPECPGVKSVQRCSICNSIKKAGEWIDPFEIGKDGNFGTIYTVCSACRVGAGLPGITEDDLGSKEE